MSRTDKQNLHLVWFYPCKHVAGKKKLAPVIIHYLEMEID